MCKHDAMNIQHAHCDVVGPDRGARKVGPWVADRKLEVWTRSEQSSNSHRHTRQDCIVVSGVAVLSESARLPEKCVQRRECAGRRRHCQCDRWTHSDAERAVGSTQFTPPDTIQTGPSCRIWRAVWIGYYHSIVRRLKKTYAYRRTMHPLVLNVRTCCMRCSYNVRAFYTACARISVSLLANFWLSHRVTLPTDLLLSHFICVINLFDVQMVARAGWRSAATAWPYLRVTEWVSCVPVAATGVDTVILCEVWRCWRPARCFICRRLDPLRPLRPPWLHR